MAEASSAPCWHGRCTAASRIACRCASTRTSNHTLHRGGALCRSCAVPSCCKNESSTSHGDVRQRTPHHSRYTSGHTSWTLAGSHACGDMGRSARATDLGVDASQDRRRRDRYAAPWQHLQLGDVRSGAVRAVPGSLTYEGRRLGRPKPPSSATVFAEWCGWHSERRLARSWPRGPSGPCPSMWSTSVARSVQPGCSHVGVSLSFRARVRAHRASYPRACAVGLAAA